MTSIKNLAIIKTGGKQYLVAKGDKIQIEKLKADKDSIVKFDQVLGTFTDKAYELGKPTVAGTVVEAKVLKQGRGKKIEVLKYKAKSKYRKKIGHRQAYTEIEITKI